LLSRDSGGAVPAGVLVSMVVGWKRIWVMSMMP
jgi:hypothetical protein